jgi:molybdenum cofactor cytidylyltransferase
VPLISRQLVALSGAGVDEVVVVTGHARAAVEREMQSFSVTLAHNDAYGDGQQGSVRVGSRRLAAAFDAVFIVPCDQPLDRGRRFDRVDRCLQEARSGHIVVPIVDGQRGNPLLLDEFAHAQILAARRISACRHLTDRQPELVYRYETGNARFIADLDTLDDVQALSRRTGWQLELPALPEIVEEECEP